MGEFLRNFLALASFFITFMDFINRNRDDDDKKKKRKSWKVHKKKKPEKPLPEDA